MEIYERTGKNAEEAILNALREFNVGRDETEIQILDAGSKGLLGFGARPAKIKMTIKFDPAKKINKFIDEITEAIGVVIESKIDYNEERKQLHVDLLGDNIGLFIGKRGQTLDSLQYLLSLFINKGKEDYIGISLDAGNYRQKRRDTLESLALSIAKKVKLTQRSVVLEPMSANERRIVHSALQNDKTITTFSEGQEPFRNVVIALKKGAGGQGANKRIPTKKTTTDSKPSVYSNQKPAKTYRNNNAQKPKEALTDDNE